ncbi:MAG TPA: hypothetical protein VF783_20120 [Terriglobales bacterium]
MRTLVKSPYLLLLLRRIRLEAHHGSASTRDRERTQNSVVGASGMRAINIPFACLFLTGVMSGQVSTGAPGPSTNDPSLAAEVQALREALSKTKQLVTQQQEIESLKAHSTVGMASTPSDDEVSMDGDAGAHVLATSAIPYPNSRGDIQSSGEGGPQIGRAEKTPTGRFKFDNSILELGGFVDLESIFRTTNTGGNIATPFGSIRTATRLRAM